MAASPFPAEDLRPDAGERVVVGRGGEGRGALIAD